MNNRFVVALLATFTCQFALAGGPPIDVNLQLITDEITRPVAVRHANDNSGRLFVVSQPGRIFIIQDGELLQTPFLDIDPLVNGGTSGGDERGFLGVAFHPEYAENGRFFVNYINLSGDTAIVEYAVSADPNVADSASASIVLNVVQDFGNHNGGDLHFGPDGYLYIGMGDGGSGGDPCSRAQQLDPDAIPTDNRCVEGDPSAALLGAMLRIDVDTPTPAGANELCGAEADGSAPYSVPSSNPFTQTSATCDEIWTYGLRNPYRFSFDRVTGDMFIGDVGQGNWEEISFAAAGDNTGINFGWDCREGSNDYSQPAPACDTVTNLVDPITEYFHQSGRCSVTGGFRFRGPLPALYGTYVYADYCTAELNFASPSGQDWTDAGFIDSPLGSISGFGEDQAGNLYVTDLFGNSVYLLGDADVLFVADQEPLDP